MGLWLWCLWELMPVQLADILPKTVDMNTLTFASNPKYEDARAIKQVLNVQVSQVRLRWVARYHVILYRY